METTELSAATTSTAKASPPPVVIHGTSARSRFGYGVSVVLDALTASHDSATDASLAIPDFDIKSEVGPKGTRTLDRAAALAMRTVGALIDDSPAFVDSSDTALILGTTMGSVASTIRFTQDGLSGSRPYLVDPARFPNTVMNFAAGQTAIRHRLTGPNATIITGSVTALSALRYAGRMMQGGQAARVIVGGSEELTPERQAIHDAASTESTALGEGSAMLLLAPSGGAPDDDRTVLRGVATAFSATELSDVVADGLIDRAMSCSGSSRGPAILILCSGGTEFLGRRIAQRSARAKLPVLDVRTVLGDTGAASAAFALAVCAETLRRGLPGPGAEGWVLAADPSGYLGIAVLAQPDSGDRGTPDDEG